ncbi:MAG: NADH-quinone oxidoreductase subunit NuoG [Halothiobacillaceae bacterium]
MSDDLITIEVDGQKLHGRQGDMLIEVTDAAGIHIPRFCYHRKLSVAANCRMCLVEVERAPKPLPACATPISEGMRVFTKSPKAIAAQRATMEFLLINHPLDCPICDQGGECELQDVAMGYGDGVGQYSETKRVVKDKDIGPLIATDMTRCIHCTRCVRFGEEIAGLRELGAIGRSEHMEIGTYIAKAVTSEISGNVIDLCPVGALTAKPSRYTFRPWELAQHAAIAPHDGLGSNIYVHTRGGKVMRVVPRENDAINEVWLSDRDRFSYMGLTAGDRLTSPMVRVENAWREAPWEEALEIAARGLKAAGSALRTLVAPHSTLEEIYLAQKLTRGLGSSNIDHRLRQRDFRDQDALPTMPWLGHDVAEIDNRQAVLVIGCHIRHEQPLLAQRLRKAALAGAKVSFVNPAVLPQTFEVFEQFASGNTGMVGELAAILAALGPEGLGGALATLVAQARVEARHEAVAASLKQAERASIYLGALAQSHPDLAVLRQLARAISAATGATLGEFAASGNSAGAWLAGAVPHRLPGGKAAGVTGLHAAAMLTSVGKANLLVGVEPEHDSLVGEAALKVLAQAECNVVLSPFMTAAMQSYAHVILPIAAFAETSGTYVNTEGRWQGMRGVARWPGEARPGWKVLRVLGNLANLEGFDYLSSEEVRDELRALCQDVVLDQGLAIVDVTPSAQVLGEGMMQRIGGVALYASDALVRRSPALQATPEGANVVVRLHPDEIARLGLVDSAVITASDAQVTLAVQADEGIPAGCAWIPYGVAQTAALGDALHVQVRKV